MYPRRTRVLRAQTTRNTYLQALRASSAGLEPAPPPCHVRRGCRELLHPIAKRLQRDTFRTRLFAVDGDDSPPPVSISFPGTTTKLVVFAWFGFGATGLSTDPNGNNVHGAVNFHGLNAALPTFNGKVTCLQVVGNLATIGGAAAIDLGPFGQFNGFAFQVLDNGEPVEGQPVDLLSPLFVLPEPPSEANCVPPGAAPEFPMTEGNIVVHDAS